MRIIAVSVALIVLLGGGAYLYTTYAGGDGIAYRTEAVTRGDLLATVSATGTVEPEDVVDVGAQVAGQIKRFGTDGKTGKPIDYSSAVEEGQPLAFIDDVLYKAKVDQSKAQLASAKAQLESAKAQLESAKAKYESAKANTQLASANLEQAKSRDYQTARDWDRTKQLRRNNAIADVDYDTAQAAYETNRAGITVAQATLAQAQANEADAKAALGTAEAAVGTAQANIEVAQATLAQDQINLDYCTIKAPVKGVVVDRRVTIGQTVQSSFNTPSLFLLAKDLGRLKVWASVNEADMGRVHTGQVVRFTVDALPGEVFQGMVGIIRLNATNTNNVITYTVEVLCDNPDGKLLPYMTTNLQFEVDRRSDALLVPNAALRYVPSPQQVVPEGRALLARGQTASEAQAPTGTGSAADAELKSRGVVWVEDNGLLRPVKVKLGLTDGNRTEVLGDNLTENTAVVTGETHAANPADEASNPFAAKAAGGKKQ
jgi:HlyD family secretion protein